MAGSRLPRFVYLTDAPAGAVQADPPARFAWRLVAANHRPIGRAAAVSNSLDACRADAQRLHRSIVDAEHTIAPSGGRWSWQLRVDGVPLAAGVHAYLRRVECLRGLVQFRAAVAAADPADGFVRTFGPNTLRGFERSDL